MAVRYYYTNIRNIRSYIELSYMGTYPARTFEYEATDGAYLPTTRTFELPVVFVGANAASLANTAIKNLMVSATSQTEGELVVNGWSLKCTCLGVTDIIVKKNRAIKFTVKFANNRNFWFKKVGSYTWRTNVWRNDDTGGTSSTITITNKSIALDIIATATNANASGQGFTINGVPTHQYKFYGSSSGTTCVIDYVERKVTSAECFKNVTDAFAEFPLSTYTISSVNVANDNKFKITVYELAVMPEW